MEIVRAQAKKYSVNHLMLVKVNNERRVRGGGDAHVTVVAVNISSAPLPRNKYQCPQASVSSLVVLVVVWKISSSHSIAFQSTFFFEPKHFQSRFLTSFFNDTTS